MDDLLGELVQEFAKAIIREGGKVTVKSMYNYISGSSQSSTSTNTPLYVAGKMFYMNDNTMLYYSTDGRRVVRGYDYYTWGDRWVDTNVPFDYEPSNFNGGIAYTELYYIDDYGNLYK